MSSRLGRGWVEGAGFSAGLDGAVETGTVDDAATEGIESDLVGAIEGALDDLTERAPPSSDAV